MKKSLLLIIVAALTLVGLAGPAAAADGVIAPQLSAVDLSAMPLISRSLSELDSDGLASDAPGIGGGSSDYVAKGSSPSWLFASLVEPFYLTMLGAALLVLGTIRGRRDV